MAKVSIEEKLVKELDKELTALYTKLTPMQELVEDPNTFGKVGYKMYCALKRQRKAMIAYAVALDNRIKLLKNKIGESAK